MSGMEKLRKSNFGYVYLYIIIVIAILVYMGWFFDVFPLKHFNPQMVRMSPLTCTMFIFCSIAVLNIRSQGRNNILYCVVPAIIVFVAVSFKIVALISGMDSFIDTILFASKLDGNRMAPNEAMDFLLSSSSILLINRKSNLSIRIGQSLSFASFLVAVVAILGYMYSIRSLYVLKASYPMAMHSVICFILLAIGIFMVKKNKGLIAVISADKVGGKLSRRMLPFAVVLPIILGWLRFEMYRAGYISDEISVSLLIISIIVISSVLIWLYARSLNIVDEQWREAQRDLILAKNIAENARKAQERFLANMSHEIRTPMNGVIGTTSLLNTTDLNEEQKGFVEIIRNSGESLLTIINDILDFSKIEAGKMELEEQPFSIQSAIEETFDLMSFEAHKKNLELLYSIEHSVPLHYIGDVTRLRQVLVNLVSNAIKFTDKGEVLVKVAVDTIDNDMYDLEIRVSDTGIGIPEDKLQRLFQAFSQADESTTRKYGGTGLGLAICAKLVQMMGGTIGVESVEGKGSTFFFTVRTKLSPETIEQDPSTANLKDKSVLIIDDNSTNLLILSRHCEKWGMHITTCDHGAKGVEYAKVNKFDLIITDMMMPDMDGIETSKAIKLTQNKNAPVVLLSSSGKIDISFIGKDKLFAISLIKPIRLNQLSQVLDSLMANDDSPRSAIEKQDHHHESQINLASEVPLRILVAEDNMINQKIAVKMLQKLGYNADVAANGLEAVNAMKRQPYDMILMDMLMPEMDGLDASRAIRKMDLRHQPLIIALTANVMQGEKEKCIEAGMNDFLSKPFMIASLRDMIEKWRNSQDVLKKPQVVLLP